VYCIWILSNKLDLNQETSFYYNIEHRTFNSQILYQETSFYYKSKVLIKYAFLSSLRYNACAIYEVTFDLQIYYYIYNHKINALPRYFYNIGTRFYPDTSSFSPTYEWGSEERLRVEVAEDLDDEVRTSGGNEAVDDVVASHPARSPEI